MIFSKRNEISKKVEQWCMEHNAPLLPINIITALDSMGLMREESQKEREMESYIDFIDAVHEREKSTSINLDLYEATPHACECVCQKCKPLDKYLIKGVFYDTKKNK